MQPQCPNGHGLMIQGQKHWICENCTTRLPVLTEIQTDRAPEALFDYLPSVIAIPLFEYRKESHPVMQLHRLCDAVEILTRFFTIVAIGELRKTLNNEPLPEEIIRDLQPRIERPTFGQWRDMLHVVVRALANAQNLLVPELPSFVSNLLLPGLEATDHPEDSLIRLRNDLVHGGAIPSAAARAFLNHWNPWLEKLVEGLQFLKDVDVCFYAADGLQRLRGTSAEAEEYAVAPNVIQAIRPLHQHVLLLRNEEPLDLWPLCDYGKAEASTLQGLQQADQSSPLVYIRFERDKLLYAALGVDFPRAEKYNSVTEFRSLFRLGQREPSADFTVDFEEEIRADSAALIGRREEMQHVKKLLKHQSDGVFWIAGPGGIGKSLLLARVAADLGNDPKRICRIVWRFRAGDAPRCNRFAFFRHAIGRIAAWLGKTDFGPANDPNKLFGQLGNLLDEVSRPQTAKVSELPPRVLFVLDGLDAIAQIDSGFPQVPFLLARPNVLWLCAGRPEGNLQQTFSADRCVHVFQDGLPPMSVDDIRAMLLDSTGSLKFKLLPLDFESTDAVTGKSQITNQAVNAVVKRAAGLPLYVHFLVQDILSGYFRFDELEQHLPPSLNAYYDDLLRRLSIGELQALLTPLLVTICWSRAPVDEETLHLMMVQRMVLLDSDQGRATLRKGLLAIESMIRPAAAAGGRYGYEPYHPTFREYVREDKGGVIGGQNEIARRQFCDLTAQWQNIPHDHPARTYVLGYGVSHLIESKEYQLLAGLLQTNFLREKSEIFGEVDAFNDAKACAERFATAGEEYWEPLLKAAFWYTEFAERIRSGPQTLETFIEQGEIARVLTAIESESDEARKGLLMLAASVLMEKSGHADPARQLKETGRTLVSDRLHSYDVGLSPLAKALLAHEGASIQSKIPSTQPTVTFTPSSNKQSDTVPFYDLLLAYFSSGDRVGGMLVGLLGPFVGFLILSLLFLGLHSQLTKFAVQASAIVTFPIIILCIILWWLSLKRRSQTEENMQALFNAWNQSEGKIRQKILLRAIRYRSLLLEWTDEASVDSPVCFMVAAQFRDATAKEAAALITEATAAGDRVCEVFIEQLCSLPKEKLEGIYRQIVDKPFRINSVWQFLRMIAATSDRILIPELFYDCLYRAQRQLKRESKENQLANLILNVPLEQLARVTIAGLRNSTPKNRLSSVVNWLKGYFWRTGGALRSPISFGEPFLWAIFYFPFWIGVPLYMPVLLLPLLFIAGIMLAGRSYDVCGFRHLVRAGNLWSHHKEIEHRAKTVGLIEAGPARPDLIRRTILAGRILTDQTLSWISDPEYSVKQIRKVVKKLMQRRLLDRRPDLVLAAMGDRKLLQAVSGVGGGKPRNLEPADHDKQLKQVLPVSSRWLHFAVVSVLALCMTYFWLQATVKFLPDEKQVLTRWIPLFVSAYLVLVQHLFNELVEPENGIEDARLKLLPKGVGSLAVMSLGLQFVYKFLVEKTPSTDQLLFIICPLITNLLVPEFIGWWRGSILLYPTRSQLWVTRLASIPLLFGSLMLLAVLSARILHH